MKTAGKIVTYVILFLAACLLIWWIRGSQLHKLDPITYPSVIAGMARAGDKIGADLSDSALVFQKYLPNVSGNLVEVIIGIAVWLLGTAVNIVVTVIWVLWWVANFVFPAWVPASPPPLSTWLL
jgi:hypothetical protein